MVKRQSVCLLLMLCAYVSSVRGQVAITANDIRVTREADSVRIEADITLSDTKEKIPSDRVLMLMPRLVAENDSAELPLVAVLGRKPYYQYIRGRNPIALSTRDVVIRAKDLQRMAPFRYRKTVKFEPWMDRCFLQLVHAQEDCCGDLNNEFRENGTLPKQNVVQAAPRVEMVRAIVKGKAYVDFPLDSTRIFDNYHDNERQLGRIRNSLDSIRNDTTNTFLHMTIKGHASPEGPYRHNEDLARERTKSLKDYVNSHYGVADSLVFTSYEPEDWAGLRRYIEQADAQQLPHRRELLDIVDNTRLRPDAKERLMRRRYPADFSHLLHHCLPYLRHSDYEIEYMKRQQLVKPGGTDTIYRLPEAVPETRYPDYIQYRPVRPVWALKTNLLFDAVLGFNVEAEVPFGKNEQWSIMAEYWTPWYVWHHNSRAYELQVVGIELRRWRRNCRCCESMLTGTFYGAYAAVGKYDFEWRSIGDQGEILSFGATIGRAWPIAKRLNLELSASVGVVFGPRRHYHGEFDDTHLIWKYNASIFYAGPTKLKCSLVWLLGNKKQKGGAL